MLMNYRPYITRNPAICGGEPVITGTRVTVRTVLASLAEGMSMEEILQDFASLSPDALRAIIAFAAISAEEDLPLPGCWGREPAAVPCTDRAVRHLQGLPLPARPHHQRPTAVPANPPGPGRSGAAGHLEPGDGGDTGQRPL